MSRKIKFGVMGCAAIAKKYMLPAIKNVSAIDLVAVASRTVSKASEFGLKFNCLSYFDYKDLLCDPEIEAIYMPLPTGLHFEWAMKCLDAGKHLLLEKSLALNYREAEELVNKAREKRLLIKENYMFAYHAQQEVVKELINLRVGKIQLFRANFGFPPLSKDNFRYDPQLGGGALLDAGGYVLKALDVFFPHYEAIIQAATLSYENNNVDVAGVATFNLIGQNQVIPCHLAFGFNHYYQCNIDVWGSKARLTTNRTFTSPPAFKANVKIESEFGLEQIDLPESNHFEMILKRYIEILNSGFYQDEYDAILKQAFLQDLVRQKALGF
jgi:predicted dehydrogenase